MRLNQQQQQQKKENGNGHFYFFVSLLLFLIQDTFSTLPKMQYTRVYKYKLAYRYAVYKARVHG